MEPPRQPPPDSPDDAIPFSPAGRTPSWTPGDVLLWMKRAMGTDPRTRNVGEARPISWPSLYLSPADPLFARKRDVLLIWARCRATGDSFSEQIRARGWSPATCYRLRDMAAAEIAHAINEAIVAGQAKGRI